VEYCVGHPMKMMGPKKVREFVDDDEVPVRYRIVYEDVRNESRNDKVGSDEKEIGFGEDDIVYRMMKNTLVVIELSPSVRKAFAAHACWVDESCRLVGNRLHHSWSDDDCGKVVLLGRCDGFPPRRG